MNKKISTSELEAWKSNYANNKDLPVITHSSVISLDHLQGFIDEAKKNSPGFNGVRIYFIRYGGMEGLNANLKHITIAGKDKAGKDFSQVSLAFVPVKDFNPATLAGNDFKLAGDEIFTLSFCHPESDKPGTPIRTGHCPPCR